MASISRISKQGVRRWDAATGERRRAPFPGGPAVRVVVGPDECTPMGVLEVTMPVGGVMPEHDHDGSAVLLVPLTGRFRLVDADGGSSHLLDAGTVATIPVGARVRLENTGAADARALVVLTPPDFAERLETWPADKPHSSKGES